MEVTRPVESKRNQENENETRVKVGRVEIWKTRGYHGKGSGNYGGEIWRVEVMGMRRRNDGPGKSN